MSYIGNDPWMYTVLHTPREKFIEMVELELRKATGTAGCLADDIADDVALDICDKADAEAWNDSDLRFGIGRVLEKKVMDLRAVVERCEASGKLRKTLSKVRDILCGEMDENAKCSGESIIFSHCGRKYILSLNFLD